MGKRKKVIFFMVDGLADKPVDGKTPLTEARKPNIDYFAENGMCGQLKLLPNSVYPDSHIANIALLGYDYKKYKIARGPLEAVGSNLSYKSGWLALRCDLATVDQSLTILDRRAGRNTLHFDQLCRFLNDNIDIGADFSFNRTLGHRAVLIIKSNLSDRITSNDPRKAGEKAKSVEALDKDALVSAKMVQSFIEKSYMLLESHPLNKDRIDRGLLPFNYVLVRDAGSSIDYFLDFSKKNKIAKAVCMAENGAVKGTCLLAGFDYMTIPETDFGGSLDFIFSHLRNALKDNDLVYVHVKHIDEPGHDGDFQRKKIMIEEFDRRLSVLKDFEGVVVLTCDHVTSTSDKLHLPGRVPVLVYGLGKKDKVKSFGELSVKEGSLKNYTPSKLWSILFKD